MKRLLLVLILSMAISGISYGQLSGPLSGTLGPGSYTVTDSIYVVAGQSLTINPGTDLLFTGAFGFGIAGELIAEGTESDSIKFMPNAGVPFWNGIDIEISGTNISFSYCYFTGAITSAIWSSSEGVNINNCYFYGNSAPEMGGGLYSTVGPVTVSDCVFEMNYSEHGGAIVPQFSTVDIINCAFLNNTAAYGGAIAVYFPVAGVIKNCLFDGNSASSSGGAIRLSSAGEITPTNCTFVNNTGGSGSAVYAINETPGVTNCIVYYNSGTTTQIYALGGNISVSYCNVEDQLWAGPGNISADPLFVAGPDGNYYLSQIAAGQGSDSPSVDAGNPASMIIGTTRTDEVLDAGVVDMGYHYDYAPNPVPNFTVTLNYNSGSPVPAGGGFINFDITLQNNETSAQTFDLWIEIPPQVTPPTVPNRNLTFPAGHTLFRPSMNWPITAAWPAGNYDMIWNIGDMSTWTAWAQDSFPFVKSADDDGSGYVLWEIEGDPLDQLFEGIDFGGAAVVSDFAVLGAYPNPFNPSTTISYTLDGANRVTLAVYDLTGREVAKLVDGYRDAGVHKVHFDASGLASGVYIYRITAGDFSADGKLVLMK